MKIVKHPACTEVIGAPADMQDGSCEGLPVMYQTTEHGQFAVSFWQPEPDDLAELLAGGGIALHVRAAGRQHPVVMVGTFPCPDGFVASGTAMEGLAERWYGPVREELAKAQAENKALSDKVAEAKKLNLNDSCKFRLTAAGAAVWNAQWGNMPARLRQTEGKAEGDEVQTQLWCLMEIFGPHTHIGCTTMIQGLDVEVLP